MPCGGILGDILAFFYPGLTVVRVKTQKDTFIVVQNCFSIIDQIRHLDETDFGIVDVFKSIELPLLMKIGESGLNVLKE